MARAAKIARATSETQITLALEVDGTGRYDVASPVGFMNHMLELFARHGRFDLEVTASGDTNVDDHHTVEDLGICLGQAFDQALGDRAGIVRYGDAAVPMDEAAAQVLIDISGRPCCVVRAPQLQGKVGEFDLELLEEFFQAFANHARMTMHIQVLAGRNNHHIAEAIFKAWTRALDRATQMDARSGGIPSTKGIL